MRTVCSSVSVSIARSWRLPRNWSVRVAAPCEAWPARAGNCVPGTSGTVVAGGSRASGYPTDLYWQPTVLDGVPSDSIAVTDETFGPIAPIMGVSSLEEAIELTNAQSYGLMAAIFTADLAAGMRYADSVHMGLVNLNETTNYWEPPLPWGGRARSESGIGRVGGAHPMDTLTELQTVLFKA